MWKDRCTKLHDPNNTSSPTADAMDRHHGVPAPEENDEGDAAPAADPAIPNPRGGNAGNQSGCNAHGRGPLVMLVADFQHVVSNPFVRFDRFMQCYLRVPQTQRNLHLTHMLILVLLA